MIESLARRGNVYKPCSPRFTDGKFVYVATADLDALLGRLHSRSTMGTAERDDRQLTKALSVRNKGPWRRAA